MQEPELPNLEPELPKMLAGKLCGINAAMRVIYAEFSQSMRVEDNDAYCVAITHLFMVARSQRVPIPTERIISETHNKYPFMGDWQALCTSPSTKRIRASGLKAMRDALKAKKRDKVERFAQIGNWVHEAYLNGLNYVVPAEGRILPGCYGTSRR